jgi:hypothetical protein
MMDTHVVQIERIDCNIEIATGLEITHLVAGTMAVHHCALAETVLVEIEIESENGAVPISGVAQVIPVRQPSPRHHHHHYRHHHTELVIIDKI